MGHDPGTFHAAEFSAGWARWIALGLFAVLVGIALLPLSLSPAVAAVAAAAAIGGGASLLWQRQRRYLLPSAAVATAGLAVLGHATSTNLGWFAVCLIGVWCALTGGRRDALVYWAGTLVLFAVEWLWVDRRPGLGRLDGGHHARLSQPACWSGGSAISWHSSGKPRLAWPNGPGRGAQPHRPRAPRRHRAYAHGVAPACHQRSAGCGAWPGRRRAFAGRGRAPRPGEPGRGSDGCRDAASGWGCTPAGHRRCPAPTACRR